jgi:hypothetical protein
MLFLDDDGGKGKSTLSALRANVWREHHRFVDPQAFVGEEEFRKAGIDFYGARFYTIQEKKQGRIQLAIWKKAIKKAITNEEIAIRPNHGKQNT